MQMLLAAQLHGLQKPHYAVVSLLAFASELFLLLLRYACLLAVFLCVRLRFAFCMCLSVAALYLRQYLSLLSPSALHLLLSGSIRLLPLPIAASLLPSMHLSLSSPLSLRLWLRTRPKGKLDGKRGG